MGRRKQYKKRIDKGENKTQGNEDDRRGRKKWKRGHEEETKEGKYEENG